MPVPQKILLRALTCSEQDELARLAHATSARWDQVRRAVALRAVAARRSFAAAAREAGFRSSGSVAALVLRFNRQGLSSLAVAAGRGRQPTYDGATRTRILALVHQAPDRQRDGTATWSLGTLQRALRKTGAAWVRLGRSTIQRVLHAAGASYQRTRTWCPPGHALRVRKAGVVLVDDEETEEKRRLIEQAYRVGEAAGIQVWCQDEAGPYQVIPQPGASWHPQERPARQPHEYVRGGTAKLLTLFRPASGELRACGAVSVPNTVVHPWVQEQMQLILAAIGGAVVSTAAPGARPVLRDEAAQWAYWLGHEPRNTLPPLQVLLIWDNLAGHKSPELVRWLFAQGVMPLYTPISGSWLNMAESVQRIIVGRALAGQQPQSQEELIGWLEETVSGWNAEPTPFTWGGSARNGVSALAPGG